MKKSLFAIVAILSGLFAAPAAHAGFLYVDVFDGTTLLHVADNSPNDIDPDPNSIIVKSSALLTAFAGKILSGSGVTRTCACTSALNSKAVRIGCISKKPARACHFYCCTQRAVMAGSGAAC